MNSTRIGAVYAERTTGAEFTLVGLRSHGQVVLAENASGSGQIIDMLPLQELAGRFTFVRCNHDDFCCTAHRTHTSPHRGCLLR